MVVSTQPAVSAPLLAAWKVVLLSDSGFNSVVNLTIPYSEVLLQVRCQVLLNRAVTIGLSGK